MIKADEWVVNCEDCSYNPYCIARLNDLTISGCGMELYQAGLIRAEDIKVRHRVMKQMPGKTIEVPKFKARKKR